MINESITRYNSYNGASVPLYNVTDPAALHAFASSHKTATKGIGAFDDYDAKNTIENSLFGISGTAGHFDRFLADIVYAYAPSYYSSFTADLSSTNVDAIGKTVDERLMAYTPLYYLIDNDFYYNDGGFGSSDVAPCWRIRTGIKQGDTSLNTEINLALALQQYNGVTNVDFETIWGQGHTQAEDTGNGTANFIAWVHEMVAGASELPDTDIVPPILPNLRSYPNPFKSLTTLRFSLSKTDRVNIEVFNLRGQRIASLANQVFSAGDHTAAWNGLDSAGNAMPSGVYFVRMHNSANTVTLRILLLK